MRGDLVTMTTQSLATRRSEVSGFDTDVSPNWSMVGTYGSL